MTVINAETGATDLMALTAQAATAAIDRQTAATSDYSRLHRPGTYELTFGSMDYVQTCRAILRGLGTSENLWTNVQRRGIDFHLTMCRLYNVTQPQDYITANNGMLAIEHAELVALWGNICNARNAHTSTSQEPDMTAPIGDLATAFTAPANLSDLEALTRYINADRSDVNGPTQADDLTMLALLVAERTELLQTAGNGERIAELDRLVIELRNNLQAAQSDLRHAVARHEQDMETISVELGAQAKARGWCDEYGQIINRLNHDLHGNLDPDAGRKSTYEVTFTAQVTITVEEADDEDDALGQAEEYLPDYAGDYSIDWDHSSTEEQ